jgi:hypothetical protein
MTDEIEKAEAELRRQYERLRKCPTMAEGGAGVESAYGQAYQALVRLGARPQLRKKYR